MESLTHALAATPGSDSCAIVWKTPPRHSFSPEDLQRDLEAAKNHLGKQRPWFVVLRDPEFLSPDPARLREALLWLAEEKSQGRIHGFGVGSQGFALDREAPGFYSLEALWDAAQTFLGPRPIEAGFQLLQAPLNLLEPGVLALNTSAGSTPAEFALKHGLQLLTYRPLHAWDGRRFVRLADFPDRSSDEDLHDRLRRSVERVAALEQNHPGLDRQGIGYRIRRASGAGPSPLGWSTFLRWELPRAWEKLPADLPAEYPQAVQDLLRDYTAWVEDEASQFAAHLKSILLDAAPELGRTEKLSSMCFRLLWSLPAVSGVACGLTHPVHVQTALDAAKAPRLRPAQVIRCFQFVDDWVEIQK